MSIAVWRGSGPRRTGGGFINRGTVTTPASPPRVAPVAVQTRIPTTAAPRQYVKTGDFVSHYDPSRVIDLDKLKVVTDMRQSGAERGESQTGDDGILGPGSDRSGTIAAPGGVPGQPGTPGSTEKNNLIPLALLIAGAILVGG